MAEEQEEVKYMNLANDLKPCFGDMIDELVKTIPEDKLYTQFTCYTIKHILMDYAIFGNTTFSSHAWYDAENKKLDVLIEHYIPVISDCYHQHGMCYILVIENGNWRVSLCTLQNNPKKDFLEYCYMKDMGQPRTLNSAYNNWLDYFEAERNKEAAERKTKWEAEHPNVEESEKAEESVNEGFFKGIFNKIFKRNE